ncbi:lipase family protein [Candidatus Laterigemmans baculatus]|uniref:lipase family protein n=1 Tax=Candidatus Laterigemmans baculatus TaxID=2770505 RepID=UPI0013DD4041|nr:lipase family protein [Candidatus Laterigemmans baculatus]
MPRIVQDVGEVPLELHSRLAGPIAALGFLEKSLLFAELAMIAYNDLDEAQRACRAIGFEDAALFDNDGSQAYRFRSRHDCVIACRGTEADEWNDIRADVNAVAVLAETVGKVHCGFKREVDDLWPMLEEVLNYNTQPLWFCGHSLGGAMATLSAHRCYRSYIRSNPTELYTFGSPRVGDRAYVQDAELPHYRWVNNNDVVTRMPPPWLGFRHTGEEVYLDRRGTIRETAGWHRVRDRLLGMLHGLRRGKIDAFSDHGIHCYVAAIHALKKAAAEPERSLPVAA